ncbi:MAG TPA: non-canonical purine NTP pyrophosphatase, partial [Ramlibacter sp.]|nr:non-canonical purine NTP pyrophosphatase [Ramlibacter sp.]
MRHRHERGDDGRRPLRRSAGHRGRRRLHARGDGRAPAPGGQGHPRTGAAAGGRGQAVKLVLASNNAGKLAELQALFAPLGLHLVRQADLGVPEAEEPHRTFVENALAKARNASAHAGLPA